MTHEELIEKMARALDDNYNPYRYPVMAAMFTDYARAVLPVVLEAVRESVAGEDSVEWARTADGSYLSYCHVMELIDDLAGDDGKAARDV